MQLIKLLIFIQCSVLSSYLMATWTPAECGLDGTHDGTPGTALSKLAMPLVAMQSFTLCFHVFQLSLFMDLVKVGAIVRVSIP